MTSTKVLKSTNGTPPRLVKRRRSSAERRLLTLNASDSVKSKTCSELRRRSRLKLARPSVRKTRKFAKKKRLSVKLLKLKELLPKPQPSK